MQDTPVIEIEDLTFAYDGVQVLRNVNLKVAEKDFVSLIGPNGGGKTTLLKLMLGLLKPKQGKILVFGTAPSRSRSRIGYVPQHFQYDTGFPVRVLDVVMMGLFGRAFRFGPFGSRDREAAGDVLGLVDLDGFGDRPFPDLSGGQRQRVLVARALIGDPDLLLLDEPTSNMDATAQRDLYALLRRLNERLTLVMVTHDVGFVSTEIKSVVCVNHDVVVHPTSDVTGELICDLYGTDVRMVRHDHRCSEEGHEWDNSPKP